MRQLFDDPVLAQATRPDGLACRQCQGTKFKTSWQTFADGTKHVRMDCGDCGAFVRYLKQPGAPGPKYEPRPPDAHAKALAPAPAPDSWAWLGLIRQADQWWRPVAYAATLGGVWDALLTFPGQGDLLAIPTRPGQARAADEGATEEPD